ncbi:TetR/AcrR family transcriptional regulator [Nocardia sp. NPDC019395]|uniref:TetR/AcrR family transcriptional regulator n=1 Tax=Nocardia sp. NPDC019395 TaxID=3154686 RepID=UPI0033FDDA34
MPKVTGRRPAISNASRGRGATEPEKRRGTGRTYRGRETRRRLLEAAKEVFERDGFIHARITDICTAAGISHGSFYTYFVTKEEIFTEVADSVEVELLTTEPAPEDTDPVQRVRLANEHYLRVYGANAKIMSVIHQVSTIDAEVRDIRLQRQNAFAQAIERRIHLLQESGEADTGIEPAYAAQALGGMVAHFTDHLFNTENDFDLDTATEQLTRIWVNALGMRYTAKPQSPEG